MGILRKSNIAPSDNNEKTPLKFSKERRKVRKEKKFSSFKKWALISFLLIFVFGGAYFGIRAYNSIRNIFAGNADVLNLLGGAQGQLLDGEVEGRVNVLLLGVGDEDYAGANLSDTIILASYDVKSKSVSMVSIPRDLYVRLPNGNYGKINASHAYGEQENKGKGPEYATRTVEAVTGSKVHYYARIDFTGMKDIVDALGGIEVYVERSFCDYEYEGRSWRNPVCFKAGMQRMNGETALMYARSRKAAGPEGSDFARSVRQQKILVAIKDKAFSAETALNPSRILAVMESSGRHLKTNFSVSEVARVYEISKGIRGGEVINKNLDPESGLVVPSNSINNGYVLIPTEGRGNYRAIHDFIKNIFLTIEIKREQPKISLLNGTWATGIYTNLHKSLTSDGFEIVDEGVARSRNHTVSQIIDYTQGEKPESIKYLEEKLGVRAQSATKTEGQTYEIRVILGSDFRG